MHFQIKNRWDDSNVIFQGDFESMKDCVLAALKNGANLYGANLSRANLSGANLSRANLSRANLSGADLSGANLSRANLSGADLSGANLYGANLYGADLYGADLYGANLSGADLSGANLSGADLSRANLSGANLYGANLYGANLSRANLYGANLYGANLYGANLSGADLYGATGIDPNRSTPLRMLLDQPGAIRAYKLVLANGDSPFASGNGFKPITYKIGRNYRVKDANTDCREYCGAGINLATLDWVMREWREGYRILIAEFKAKDIAAIPTATDGKFRVFRCRIVAEKDLVELGLVKKPEEKTEAKAS